jgi:AcrR family transcriptional regulator
MDQMEKRGPGRPRSDSSRQAILGAAYDLLAEKGMAAFTIEGVAARSGSAKTTIYRWWPSRGMLATDALLCRMAREVPIPHTESALADLRTVMHGLAHMLSSETGRVVAGLIAEAQCCSETSNAITTNLINRRRQAGREIVERGIASGEICPSIDIETVLDALYGPIYARLLLRRMPLEEPWVDKLADTVFHGICPGSTRKSAKTN